MRDNLGSWYVIDHIIIAVIVIDDIIHGVIHVIISTPNHESSIMMAVLAMRVNMVSIKSGFESLIIDAISLMLSCGFRIVEKASSKPMMGKTGSEFISWYDNGPFISACFGIVQLVPL